MNNNKNMETEKNIIEKVERFMNNKNTEIEKNILKMESVMNNKNTEIEKDINNTLVMGNIGHLVSRITRNIIVMQNNNIRMSDIVDEELRESIEAFLNIFEYKYGVNESYWGMKDALKVFDEINDDPDLPTHVKDLIRNIRVNYINCQHRAVKFEMSCCEKYIDTYGIESLETLSRKLERFLREMCIN